MYVRCNRLSGPSGVPATTSASRVDTLVGGVAVVLLVKTLGASAGVGVWERSLPLSGLASLSVCIDTAGVLAVASILASLAWA